MENSPDLPPATSEALLRAAAGGYRSLIEQLPAVPRLLLLDPISTLDVGPEVEALTGYPPQRLIDEPGLWLQMIHHEDRERIVVILAEHAARGTPISEEYRMSAPGGRVVWVREESRAILGDSGRPVASQGILLDVTERKRVEQDLESNVELRKALSARLLTAEEDERARVAAEIYDGPLQVLSEQRLRLDLVGQVLVDERQLAELNDIARAMDRAIHRLELSVSDVHPPLRDAIGLVSVIRFLLRELSEFGGVITHLDERLSEELSPETCGIVYRIVNECLTNISQHAHARNAVVAMESSAGGVLVAVEDNGTGFDAARIDQDPVNHIGLQLMGERAEAAGGRYRVESARGSGTTIEFWLPSSPMREDGESSLGE